jgi:hypothetical protein
MKSIKLIDGIITKGAFIKNVRNVGFDKLYHLGLLIELKNGQKYILEKNEEVDITNDLSSLNKLSEFMNINIPNDLTINKIFENALNKFGERRLYVYDAFSFNCQRFILDLLESNNLSNQLIYNFVYQDVSALIDDTTRVLQRYAKGATNFKAWINKITGKGF